MDLNYFQFSIFVLLLTSCSNENTDQGAKDSVADSMSIVSSKQEFETDSGKLVITHIQGVEIDSAVLYGKDGKISARGFMFNNKPSGAWVYYDANGNITKAEHFAGESMKYNLDVEDFKTSRITFKEMGISAEIPVNWKPIESPNTASLISYEKVVTEDGILMMPNFNIAKGKIEAGQTLESLAAEQLNMLHQNVGRVELIDESFLMIDSCKSFRRYGMYFTENNKVGFLDAIIVKGDTIWVISCAAQNREQGEFLKYQSVFESLVMSIKIAD